MHKEEQRERIERARERESQRGLDWLLGRSKALPPLPPFLPSSLLPCREALKNRGELQRRWSIESLSWRSTVSSRSRRADTRARAQHPSTLVLGVLAYRSRSCERAPGRREPMLLFFLSSRAPRFRLPSSRESTFQYFRDALSVPSLDVPAEVHPPLPLFPSLSPSSPVGRNGNGWGTSS